MRTTGDHSMRNRTHRVEVENTQPDTIDLYGNPEPFWFAECRHGFWEDHSYHTVIQQIHNDLDHRGQSVDVVRVAGGFPG